MDKNVFKRGRQSSEAHFLITTDTHSTMDHITLPLDNLITVSWEKIFSGQPCAPLPGPGRVPGNSGYEQRDFLHYSCSVLSR